MEGCVPSARVSGVVVNVLVVSSGQYRIFYPTPNNPASCSEPFDRPQLSVGLLFSVIDTQSQFPYTLFTEN